MQRRAFLHSTAVAGLAAGTLLRSASADDKPASAREFYELRTYTLKDDAQRKLVDEYLEKAFIPAMNRLGSAAVGVFSEQKLNAPVYVLIPHASIEQFLKSTDALMADAEYTKAGADYLTVEVPNKAYERIDSSLLQALEGHPKMALPPQAKDKKAHIVQLRIYESPSETAGKKKIEMFNKGEIDAFKRSGTNPVFFSETIIGAKRPSLTYMLSFDDKPALEKAWGVFVKDPDFHKMIGMAEYSDKKIVSKINNSILNTASYSQI
jgi:hypothetical protein